MAETVESIAVRVFNRAGGTEEVLLVHIKAMVPDALTKLGERVADDPDEKGQFEVEYTVAASVDGTFDLNDLYNQDERPLLAGTHRPATFRLTDSTDKWEPVADVASLDRPWPPLFVYFALDGTKVHTRDRQGRRNSFAGKQLKFRGNCVPELADVDSFITDIEEILLAMILPPPPPKPARKHTPPSTQPMQG